MRTSKAAAALVLPLFADLIARCALCDAPIAISLSGRHPRFCGSSCRSKAWRHRNADLWDAYIAQSLGAPLPGADYVELVISPRVLRGRRTEVGG